MRSRAAQLLETHESSLQYPRRKLRKASTRAGPRSPRQVMTGFHKRGVWRNQKAAKALRCSQEGCDGTLPGASKVVQESLRKRQAHESYEAPACRSPCWPAQLLPPEKRPASSAIPDQSPASASKPGRAISQTPHSTAWPGVSGLTEDLLPKIAATVGLLIPRQSAAVATPASSRLPASTNNACATVCLGAECRESAQPLANAPVRWRGLSKSLARQQSHKPRPFKRYPLLASGIHQ